MGRAGGSPPFRVGTPWPEWAAHAWKRGAVDQIRHGLEIFRVVFEVALATASLPGEEVRARSGAVHDLLLGAMVRNMVDPIPQAEVAHAVSAISGIELDPDRC